MKHSRRASGSSATSIASDSCCRCTGKCPTKMWLALLLLSSLFGTGEKRFFSSRLLNPIISPEFPPRDHPPISSTTLASERLEHRRELKARPKG